MQWWVHTAYHTGGLELVAAWAFWVIFSITLHELGHGWAALWQGDKTPKEMGHMTWNPWVHMGGWSLAMFALIGIAWGMMPTRPDRYRWGRRGRIVIAAAGPLMNVLLALITLSGLALLLHSGPAEGTFQIRLAGFLAVGGFLNIILAGLNLLPVPPLDGAQILSGTWYRFYEWMESPAIRQYSFYAILAIFFLTPIGPLAFAWSEAAATDWVVLLGGDLPEITRSAPDGSTISRPSVAALLLFE